jgi:hypothetical protein
MELSPAVSAVVGVGGLVVATLASWSSLLVVVRGHVVPGWGVSAGVLVVALVLRWVLGGVRRSAGGGAVPSKRAGWVRPGNRLLIGTAVLGIAWGAVADLVSEADYHVLHPAGPGGCTVVVRETSFLMISNDEAYAVGPLGLALGRSGSWVIDDGYRPIDAGTYALDWGRDGGLLRISGTSTDPVVSGGSDGINCGW